MSIPFKCVPESDEFEEKLIWIKQCRLHYFFGNKRSAHELFNEKEIEFHLFVTKRENVLMRQQNQYITESSNTQQLKISSSDLQVVSLNYISY